MEDERLLAEALRAQAAGGVSTPAGIGGPGPSDGPDDGATHPAEGSSRVGGRFRPLGRGRRSTPSPRQTVASDAPRAGAGAVPTPAGGARPAPGPGAAPGGRSAPRPTPAAGTGPFGRGPGGAPAAPPRPEPAGWTATRVAWWSAVAVLGGGVLGAVLAVISLAAPG